MEIKDEVLTLLEVRHNEGVSKKTGNAYSIYSLVFGDDDYNRLNAQIGKDLLVEGVIPDWVFKAAQEKTQVSTNFRIIPDGFGVKMIVDELKEA